MLKTMLSASPQLDFVDELFLFCPRWLHRDLNSNVRKHVGELSAPDALDRLLEFLYSGIPYGWFWSLADRELDRDMLKQELSQSGLSMQELFRAIMTVHARMRGKSSVGAKFPLHYSQVDKLLTWFPDCRLIHTTRNPKAVYASQAAKYLTKSQGPVFRYFSRIQQFVHINIQTTGTASVHRKLRGLQNYRLIRYEDVVLNPRKELEEICSFLGVRFCEEMLQQHQYGSSFDSIGGGKGVSRSSLNRWRYSISPVTRIFMDNAHMRANRLLGYAIDRE